MTQSEESVTLMTFYRFPHRGSRFFANMHNGAFCPVSSVTAAFAEERGSLKFKIFSPKLLTRKSSFAKIITIFKSADGKK